jgi:hypothetical protein
MVSGGVLVAGPPTTTFYMDWDLSMDTGVTPSASSFTCIVDGSPQSISVLGWTSSVRLGFQYSGAGPSSSGVLNLNSDDSNLRSDEGSLAHAPDSGIFYP